MMQFLKPRIVPPLKLSHFSQTPSTCVRSLRIESNIHTHTKRIKLFSPMVQLPRGPELDDHYSDTPHCVGLIWTSDQPNVETSTNNTQHSQQTDIHAPSRMRTRNFSKRVAADPNLRPRCHWDRPG